MENIGTTQTGDKLDISVDLTKELGLTKTGRSMKIANSRGWVPFGDPNAGYKFTLLVIKRRTDMDVEG